MSDIVNDLKNIEDRHKNDTVFTGSINIALMAYECRREIEILREDLKAYRATGLSPERVAELAEAEKDGCNAINVNNGFGNGLVIFSCIGCLYNRTHVVLDYQENCLNCIRNKLHYDKFTRAEAEAALERVGAE